MCLDFLLYDNLNSLLGHVLGKELNKLKNKGLLVGAEDDKQTAYGPEESIAEGELLGTKQSPPPK